MRESDDYPERDEYPERPRTLEERIGALSQAELIDYITENMEQGDWWESLDPDGDYWPEPKDALWGSDLAILREMVIEDIKGKL